MKLTYRKLQEVISKMTDDQKDCNVVVFNGEADEYYSVDHISFTDDSQNDLTSDYPVLDLFI